LCRQLNVTRGGFYAWLQRAPSQRRAEDARLQARISDIHQGSHGAYGSPRIHRALRTQGIAVARKRVARLMRDAGIYARVCGLYRPNAANHAFFASVPNRQRALKVHAPDQVWFGDVTYLKVNGEWRYMAAVMDRYSRRLLAWRLGTRRDVRLTSAALNAAVTRRSPAPGLVFHTDRGIEYAAYKFRDRAARLGITQSMNRPGKMTDNAHMESFFHSMKSDVIHGRQFHSEKQLRATLKSYIDFYNRERIHSALDYVSPATYEALA
jgi:transposase InsO family protein